jgi:hypothetical protein
VGIVSLAVRIGFWAVSLSRYFYRGSEILVYIAIDASVSYLLIALLCYALYTTMAAALCIAGCGAGCFLLLVVGTLFLPDVAGAPFCAATLLLSIFAVMWILGHHRT